MLIKDHEKWGRRALEHSGSLGLCVRACVCVCVYLSVSVTRQPGCSGPWAFCPYTASFMEPKLAGHIGVDSLHSFIHSFIQPSIHGLFIWSFTCSAELY